LIPLVALRDLDRVGRLALAERDLAERPLELAVEQERQVLFDDKRSVGLDLDQDACFGEGEALAVSRRSRDERDQRGGER
jgi:hypothetical protein